QGRGQGGDEVRVGGGRGGGPAGGGLHLPLGRHPGGRPAGGLDRWRRRGGGRGQQLAHGQQLHRRRLRHQERVLALGADRDLRQHWLVHWHRPRAAGQGGLRERQQSRVLEGAGDGDRFQERVAGPGLRSG